MYPLISGEGTSSSAGMTFGVSVSNSGLGISTGDGGSISMSNLNDVNLAPFVTGMASQFNGSSDMKTMTMHLPVNVPLKLVFTLSVSSMINFGFDMSLAGYQAQADFGHTFGLATDKPVFDLPAGFTVDSVEAGVVDNTFTAPVPEPSTFALLALGICGLGLRRQLRSISSGSLG